MLSLSKGKPARHLALALRFLDRSPHAKVTAARKAPGTVNYLAGRRPAAGQTGLSQYREIVYRNLWPRIDLRLRERDGVLKYEFHVRPGGRVSDIRLAYAGARRLAVGADGALRIRTALGVLRDSRPVTYQTIDGTRVPVSSSYRLDERGQGAALRVRRRSPPARPRAGDRPRRAVRDLPRRQQQRDRCRHRGRRQRQLLHRRHDAVAQLPHHHGSLRAHRRRQQLRRRLRDEAEPGRDRPGLLDVRRRQRHGVRQRHRRGRGRQRLRHRHHEVHELPDHRRARSTAASTPRATVRAAASTTPTGSSSSSTPPARALTYSTYLGGGTDIDSPRGIAVERRRERLRRRRDAVQRLPDDGRCLRPDQVRPDRHVRHEAQPGRVGSGVLDLPGRRAGRQRPERHGRRRQATPTPWGRRARPTSRPPPGPSTGRRTAGSTAPSRS